LVNPGTKTIQNVVFQPIIDKEEIDEAYKFAEEDGDQQIPTALPTNSQTINGKFNIEPTENMYKVKNSTSVPTTSQPTSSTSHKPSQAPPTTSSQPTATNKPSSRLRAITPVRPATTSKPTSSNKPTSTNRANPPIQMAQKMDVGKEGNCFFRAVSYGIHRHERNFAVLRRQAVQGLIWIDENWTEDQKEEFLEVIGGVLPGERQQLLDEYNNDITNFAENYTKINKNWGGVPEAIALAKILNRTIIIINGKPICSQNL
jgi:hypothetical protein